MRLLLSGMVAAGLLTSQIAAAACVSPADREALDVAGLKTQLMVQTLTCHTDAQYNAFINKFKPELNGDERTAKNYFAHRYGRAGQTQHDRYLTTLANGKSDVSQKDGSRFCAHNEDIFTEVLALKNGAELREYAAGRISGLPETLTTCESSEATSSHPTTTTTHRSSRRRG